MVAVDGEERAYVAAAVAAARVAAEAEAEAAVAVVAVDSVEGEVVVVWAAAEVVVAAEAGKSHTSRGKAWRLQSMSHTCHVESLGSPPRCHRCSSCSSPSGAAVAAAGHLCCFLVTKANTSRGCVRAAGGEVDSVLVFIVAASSWAVAL